MTVPPSATCRPFGTSSTTAWADREVLLRRWAVHRALRRPIPPISHPFAQFLADTKSGQLPNVSFLDPNLLGEVTALPMTTTRWPTSAPAMPSCHRSSMPWRLDRVGQDRARHQLRRVGGFFDHVPPRRVTPGIPAGAQPSSGVDTDLNAQGKVLSGFRVPCIVVSPFTQIGGSRGGVAVNHNFYDHTSVLKLIECAGPDADEPTRCVRRPG